MKINLKESLMNPAMMTASVKSYCVDEERLRIPWRRRQVGDFQVHFHGVSEAVGVEN